MSFSYREKGCSLLHQLDREAACIIGACKMHNWPQLKREGSTAAANASFWELGSWHLSEAI